MTMAPGYGKKKIEKNYKDLLFTESAPRPIQSTIGNVKIKNFNKMSPIFKLSFRPQAATLSGNQKEIIL